MSSWVSRSRCFVLVVLPLLMAVNAGCKEKERAWPLWDAYASHFMNEQGRIVDPQGGDRTTSEGQSYALFFALVNNDRTRFGHLLSWTQANLAGGDMEARLPGWLWGKGTDGQWKLQDSGTAADSDCWIAYTLLEAGRLWKHKEYTDLGHKMLVHISEQEVAELPNFGWMLLPGQSAAFVHNGVWMLNPSYTPHFLFQRFAEVDPTGPWEAVAMNIPKLLRMSSRKGFAMDWVNYQPGDGFTPVAHDSVPIPGQPLPPAFGSYDAIRVYLWAGMENAGGKSRADILSAIPGMATYLADHGAPPEKVNDQGVPLAQDGPVGFSAAVLPYLSALPNMSKAADQQKARVAAQFNPATGVYGKEPVPVYYNQNLILFAVGFAENRFSFGPGGELKVEWAH